MMNAQEFLTGERKLTDNAVKTRSASIAIAMTAIFSAMAVVVTLTRLTIPFPPLPYLKIDFSEVPVTVALMLLGPVYGSLSAVIYWIVLTMRAGDILGPAMKFAAVISMLVGFWLASVVMERWRARGRSLTSVMVVGFLFGSALRVVVMSFFNYVVLLYIAPYYVDFIGPLLGTIGLPSGSTMDVVIWSLILTGIYNVIHTAVSIFPAYLLTRASLERIPAVMGGSWVETLIEKGSA